MERLKDSWESERVEIDELRDLGERVLARWLWLTVGKQSGIASEIQVTTVSTIRQEKIIRVDYFFEAGGLSGYLLWMRSGGLALTAASH